MASPSSGSPTRAFCAAIFDTITIDGNFLGLDASGLSAPGNAVNGVLFDGVTASTIGGVTPASRNVIAGNVQAGVLITGASSADEVAGNLIGTDATGAASLGNGDGVKIDRASHIAVGGFVAAARQRDLGQPRQRDRHPGRGDGESGRRATRSNLTQPGMRPWPTSAAVSSSPGPPTIRSGASPRRGTSSRPTAP